MQDITQSHTKQIRITKRNVDAAAGSYQNALQQWGENNMVTQRAEFEYRELQSAYLNRHTTKGG